MVDAAQRLTSRMERTRRSLVAALSPVSVDGKHVRIGRNRFH